MFEENETVVILEDGWEAAGKGVFRLIGKGRASKVLD